MLQLRKNQVVADILILLMTSVVKSLRAHSVWMGLTLSYNPHQVVLYSLILSRSITRLNGAPLVLYSTSLRENINHFWRWIKFTSNLIVDCMVIDNCICHSMQQSKNPSLTDKHIFLCWICHCKQILCSHVCNGFPQSYCPVKRLASVLYVQYSGRSAER